MANPHSSSDSTALRDETMLRRVRHLGSARDGLREWQLQRTTALALIPLGLYFAAWSWGVANRSWVKTASRSTWRAIARS